tara:strand:- start:7287 stop:7400 length:114 start_codon:yes stop_codon:yes gene_type:complete
MNRKVSDKAMQLSYSLGMIVVIILSIGGFIFLLSLII